MKRIWKLTVGMVLVAAAVWAWDRSVVVAPNPRAKTVVQVDPFISAYTNQNSSSLGYAVESVSFVWAAEQASATCTVAIIRGNTTLTGLVETVASTSGTASTFRWLAGADAEAWVLPGDWLVLSSSSTDTGNVFATLVYESPR